MDLNEYQKQTHETAVFPKERALEYTTLGLVGEAGEIANKVKKLIRDEDTKEKREAIAKELGDTLWYVSELATALEIDLNTVAANNLSKLWRRKMNNTLRGSGDNR